MFLSPLFSKIPICLSDEILFRLKPRFQFLLIFLENKKSTFDLPLPPKISLNL